MSKILRVLAVILAVIAATAGIQAAIVTALVGTVFTLGALTALIVSRIFTPSEEQWHSWQS